MAGFDFGGDGHAGGEGDDAVVDLHLRLVELDAGGVDKLLPFGFAGVIFASGVPAAGWMNRFRRRAFRARWRPVRRISDLAVQQAVFGEVEGVDLDRRLLPRMHEADILVRDHRLDLQMAVGGHDGHQHLRRRHHAAFGMDGKLLHRALDRRCQRLQPEFLRCLHQLFVEARGLLLGLRQQVEVVVFPLGLGLFALLLEVRQRTPSLPPACPAAPQVPAGVRQGPAGVFRYSSLEP